MTNEPTACHSKRPRGEFAANFQRPYSANCDDEERAPARGRDLLHEADSRRRRLGTFLDWAKLRFVARDIFAERAPDAFRVTRADDHALQQLALRAVRENVNKIERELFQ